MSLNMSNQIRELIIKELARGRFVSGQELGDLLGISRAAISKHIKALTKIGLDIFSVTGKGYRLAEPISLLNEQTIHDALLLESIKIPLEIHSLIDSTNSYLLTKVPKGLEAGHCCIAEYQSAGRGRRGKKWYSPYGSHLYLSYYWPLDQGMVAAMGVSLVVGLAITDCLQEYGINAQLKWPNDIYVDSKKIAGVLVELEGQSYGVSHAVIGIGLNVNMPKEVGNEIDQPWTDIKRNTSIPLDRNLLVAKLITSITKRLIQHKQVGFKAMLVEWHEKDFFLSKPIAITAGDTVKVGICRGVNEQGALLLEINGKIEQVFGGEISVRGHQ
jgi:BirA family biotin operon repressor/biotin-[acetyl-CoA-carboxylase] ligase